MKSLPGLLSEVRGCQICAEHSPDGPRPMLVAYADAWHAELLRRMPKVELTLLLSRHAQARYLGADAKPTLTATVKAWKDYLPDYLPLPHPSPRNNRWLAKNTWFESEVLPHLRKRVRAALN